MMELLPKDLYIDFVGKRNFFSGISALMVLISILLFVFVGPNWSIDFTGGTEVQMHFKESTDIGDVREALGTIGISEDSIQLVGPASDNRYLVRLQGASSANQGEVDAVRSALVAGFGADWIEEFDVDEEVGTRASVSYKGPAIPLDRITAALASLPGVKVQSSPEENEFYARLPGVAEEIRATLAKELAGHDFELERTDSVGPKVGGNLRAAGLTSMVVTMVLLTIYVGVRFDFAFAPGAILCLFHDAALTCGFFVLTQQEFGLSMISAILTLVGYSINDTIVIYDRIRENMEKYRKQDLHKLINDSINQTLSRSIITNGATALALVPFLIWGGSVLRTFATAMIIGIIVGSYSTIYVASPLMIIIKENQDSILRLFGLNKKPPSGPAAGSPDASAVSAPLSP
ncbi:MAG: protein translocase subunit SecF [Myxococcota bacterium]